MSHIERVFPIGDGVAIASVRDTVAANLRDMAKASVVVTDDCVRFSIAAGRWWYGGLPMDLIDGGEIRFDGQARTLSYALSMRRADIGCLAAAVSMGIAAHLILELPIWGAALTGLGILIFLWVGNHLTAEAKVENYFRRLAGSVGME